MGESSQSIPVKDLGKHDAAITRYYNDAVMGLDELFEAALTSDAARDELRAEADRLVKRGIEWRDLKYSKGRT